MAESKRVQRLLRVFIALDEHPIIGLSNKDLSVGLGLTPSQVSRDIDDLVASGLVIKLENGNYAYGIKTLQIAERFRKQQERLNARLQELENTLSPCFPSIPAMSSCSQEERHCFSYGRNRPSAKSSTTSTANSLTFTA